MWVFCCGMYRSASTLQFQITAHLVRSHQLGQQIGWIDANRFPELRSLHQNTAGLNVIKVHRCTEAIITEFNQNRAIGIYSFRDLRDVYASMMTQRMKSFEFLWQDGFLTECLDNYRCWTTQPNVLVSRYQAILEDLPAEVQRIAAHLGVAIDRQQAQQIAADFTLDIQQTRITQFRQRLLASPLEPNDHREIVDYHAEESLLHINHIGAVKPGQWQSDLSNDQVDLIERAIQAWCQENGYDPSIFLV